MEFFAEHEPAAQPRPRFNRRTGRTYHKRGKCTDYRDTVKESCYNSWGGRKPYRGPVRVEIFFYFPRPKSLTWKKKKMRRLWKSKKPDIDNCVKSTLDAMNGIAFEDDGQVSELFCKKFLVGDGDTVGTLVRVTPLQDQP